MDFGDFLLKAEQEAELAKMPVDKYLSAIVIREKAKKAEEKARQISGEEKEKTLQAIKALDGNVSEDLLGSITDLLNSAGVRPTPGAKLFARYHIQQLLLEHKK